MGLNRMMFIKKSAGSGGDTGDNAFIMTMGTKSSQYGYNINNGYYGEVTGNVTMVKLQAMLHTMAEPLLLSYSLIMLDGSMLLLRKRV